MLFLLAVEKHSPTAKHFFQLQTLQSENSNLRKQASTKIYQVQTGSEYPDTSNHSSLKRRPSARGSRPMSMYETGSGQKAYLPVGEANHPEESRTRLQPFPAHVSTTTGASPAPLCSLPPAFPPLNLEMPVSLLRHTGLSKLCLCFNILTDAVGAPQATGSLGKSSPLPFLSLWELYFLITNFLPHFQKQKPIVKVATISKCHLL